MARNRLLRTAPRLALLSAFGLFCFGAQKKTTMLTVTAIAYRVIPHERTIEDQTAGHSNTACYGSGTYFGYTSYTAVNCSTITIPPQTRSTSIRTIEVFNQLEADGTIYTVRCSAHWVGSNCSWLIPGDEFWAEIQGTTMWVSAREGGNVGKEIHPKFQVLDVRTKPVVNVLAKPVKEGDQLDNGAIVEMIKRGVSEDSIIARISARPGSYALYPDALPALRTVGVSQSVLAAMSANNDHPQLPPVSHAAPALPAPVHAAAVVAPREMSAEEIFRRFASTVVFVACEISGGKFQYGSGVLVSADGFLVTNAHVVEGCQRTKATYIKGSLQRSFDARVRYSDTRTDVAVLKIDASGLEHFDLTAKQIRIGQQVFAIGNPKGLAQTISDGIISGLREEDGVSWVQHSAPISRGGSGGALISAGGDLLGINRSFLDDAQNLNFAVPLSAVLAAMATAEAK